MKVQRWVKYLKIISLEWLMEVFPRLDLDIIFWFKVCIIQIVCVNNKFFDTVDTFNYFACMDNEIINILKQNKSQIFSKYTLQSMAVFGSYSRGDNTKNSDVDILVDLNGQICLKFLHLNY